MRIKDIETIFADRFMFVRVRTDTGLTGLGESGTWGHLEASAQAVETFRRYLIGRDPLRIEHHSQFMYRSSHFRGAAVMGAISAIDIALWDIAGKHLNVPAYQLLGGRCRDRARVYYHVIYRSHGELVEGCRRAKRMGFTAVGHLSPFVSESFDMSHSMMMKDAADRVGEYREAVGDDVDLCIEIHRELRPAQAIVLGNLIEKYRPMFYEDPVPPDNLDAMARVARHVNIPIATGERLLTPQEFEMLLRRDAAEYIRPDVCTVGGLTGAKKIAAIAEANYVGVIPHNPLSRVSTAACIQLAACISNFVIQEYPRYETMPVKDLVKTAVELEEGYLRIPDAPGIGAELNDDVLEKFPYRPRTPSTMLRRDGSIVDCRTPTSSFKEE
ncbi:MAG: mandelate racemase/muconate lactonizing enzyme family protein [Candidatus Bathyarchaeota archaeon]|nr:mandelate racemase/muconate lactonizing enzyme family protein [Candidatus Bathyarchaeota archaeon]